MRSFRFSLSSYVSCLPARCHRRYNPLLGHRVAIPDNEKAGDDDKKKKAVAEPGEVRPGALVRTRLRRPLSRFVGRLRRRVQTPERAARLYQ